MRFRRLSTVNQRIAYEFFTGCETSWEVGILSEISNQDWAKIHAKAWRDPQFRALLESDPTAAIKQYGNEVGKTFTRILKLKDRPKNVADADLDQEESGPPACC